MCTLKSVTMDQPFVNFDDAYPGPWHPPVLYRHTAKINRNKLPRYRCTNKVKSTYQFIFSPHRRDVYLIGTLTQPRAYKFGDLRGRSKNCPKIMSEYSKVFLLTNYVLNITCTTFGTMNNIRQYYKGINIKQNILIQEIYENMT